MGSGVTTILFECSASCWQRQFTARSSESTFHDYFHLVWCFEGFCIYELDDVLTRDMFLRVVFHVFPVYTNWTMFNTEYVSSRRPFSRSCHFSFVYELTRWLGECYDGPSGYR